MCYLDPHQFKCIVKDCNTMVDCCGCVAEMFGPGHDEAHIICEQHKEGK